MKWILDQEKFFKKLFIQLQASTKVATNAATSAKILDDVNNTLDEIISKLESK